MLWINLGLLFSFLAVWFCVEARFWAHGSLEKLLSRIILIVIVSDGIFTLIGQSPVYWHDYSKFNEANLLGGKLMAWHPLAFTLALMGWVVLTAALIRKASVFFSRLLFFALFLGHSLAAWTWAQYWIEKGIIENLVGKGMSALQITLYWEYSQYMFYILLGLILAMLFTKSRRLK